MTEQASLALLDEIQSYWRGLLPNLEAISSRQNYAMPLTARSLGFYEASCLLVKNGHTDEVSVMTRALLECIFKLGALEKDKNDELVEKIVMSDKVHLIEEAAKMPDSSSKQQLLDDTSKDISILISKGLRRKRIAICKMAELAEMTPLYNVAYLRLSLIGHSSEHELKRLAIFDDQKQFKGFALKTDHRTLKQEAATVAHFGAIYLMTLAYLFEFDAKDAIGFFERSKVFFMPN